MTGKLGGWTNVARSRVGTTGSLAGQTNISRAFGVPGATGAFGGRTNVSRPTELSGDQNKRHKSQCVVESFNGADSDIIGPDQPWIFYPSVPSTAPRVQANVLTVRKSPPSANSVSFDARAEANSGSADHRTRVEYATASTLGAGSSQLGQYDIGVFARMGQFPGDLSGNDPDPASFEIGNYAGWHFFAGAAYGSDGMGGFVTTPYANLELFYYDAGGAFFSGATYGSVSSTPVPSAGDEVAVAVTGTGTGTRILCTYNGTAAFDVSGTDLTTWLTANSIPAGDLPGGMRGGCSIFGIAGDGTWAAANDDLVALDNFSTCPA